MFIGEYQHTIDQKGRVNVPAKFREVLGATFIVSKGFDGCLFGYHLDDWKQFEKKLKKIPLSNPDGRKLVRFFTSSAADVTPDNLGRINIPPGLREHAGLKKEIISIGAGNRVEIWDKDNWLNYTESYIENELAGKIEEYGI
jgi:MraZ protein